MTPAVSVLLPTHNGGPFLRAAIDSILAQSFRDFELIVIDDGSTDGSGAIVESYRDERVSLVRHQTNRGLAASLNEGLRCARAPLVARQDSDDLSGRERFANQLRMFADEPDLALVGTRAWLIDEHDRRLGVVDRCLEPASIGWYGLLDNPFIHTSVMFRTGVVRDALHGYDESRGHSEDFDLWSRLLRGHRARNLSERLVSYRQRSSSMMGEVEHLQDGGARRDRFVRVVREVVAANVRAVCGSDTVSDDDAGLLSGYILGIEHRRLDAFLGAFLRLLSEYERAHPGLTRTPDFSRTLARQFDAIAYRVRPPSRRSALRVFGLALLERPRIAPYLAWLRSLALVTVGHAARRRAGAALASSAPW